MNEINCCKLGLFSADLLVCHETAWLYGDRKASDRLSEVLSEIKTMTSALNLGECTSILKSLSDRWSESFNSPMHRGCVAIAQALAHHNPDSTFSPSMLLAQVAARVCFPGQKPTTLRDKEKKLRVSLQRDIKEEKNRDWKLLAELTAGRAAEVFSEDFSLDEQGTASELNDCLSQLADLIELDKNCPHSPQPLARIKPIDGRRGIKLHVLTQSPALKVISELIPHLARKIEKIYPGTWFSLGLHGGLLSSLPEYLPGSMFGHPLLLPNSKFFPFGHVPLGPPVIEKVQNLLKDESDRLSLTGEWMRIIESLCKKSEEDIVPGPRKQFCSDRPQFYAAIERESALLPAVSEVNVASGSAEPNQSSELIGADDVCAMLDIGTSTLYNWRDSGKLPQPVRIGGTVKWRREEVLAWIDAGCPPEVRWDWKRKKQK